MSDIELTIRLTEGEVRTLRRWEPETTAHRYHDTFIGTIIAKRALAALPRPIEVGDKVQIISGSHFTYEVFALGRNPRSGIEFALLVQDGDIAFERIAAVADLRRIEAAS